MEAVARDLIRAIRGKRSQEALSRRLGYTSNPVQDWEGGRRFPTGVEALRAASLSGIQVMEVFEEFSTEELPPPAKLTDVGLAVWMSSLKGSRAIAEIAVELHCSRSRVSRWLGGVTRPRLPDFLRLIDVLTGRLVEWVALLVPIEKVPQLAEVYQRKQASRALAFDHPWTEAVLRLLETQAYRALPAHVPGWLCARLQISLSEEERCLEHLVRAGVIGRRGRRYRALRPLTVDTQADPEKVWALKEHWARASVDRIHTRSAEDYYSYNIVSLSRRDLERLRELHLRYFKDVRALVASSDPVEVAAMVITQLVEFSEPGIVAENDTKE